MNNYNIIPFHLLASVRDFLMHSYNARPEQRNFYSHDHADFEFFIFLEGDAEMVVEGKSYALKENDLLVIPAGVSHFLKLKGDAPYRRIVFYVTLDTLSHLGLSRFANELCCGGAKILCNLTDSDFLSTMPNASKIAVTRLDAESQSALFSERLLSLYMSVISARESADANGADSIVSRAIKYINNNLDAELSIKIISDALHVSGSYLCKIFKSGLGISLMHYVNRQRVLRAKKLIMDRLPLKQVAVLCGFENYPTFFRVFKNVTGQSPSESIRDL